MNIETRGLGAGSYPQAPEPEEMVTVKLECSLVTYVSIPESYADDYSKAKEYIEDSYSNYELIEEADKINIEWISK